MGSLHRLPEGLEFLGDAGDPGQERDLLAPPAPLPPTSRRACGLAAPEHGHPANRAEGHYHEAVSRRAHAFRHGSWLVGRLGHEPG